MTRLLAGQSFAKKKIYMTKAICWKCGVFKTGSFVPCPNCNADPITEDDRLISLFLTDHYHDEASLNALHVQIRSGSKQYVISDEIKEQMRPALAAVSRMLGDDIKNDPLANQNQKPMETNTLNLSCFYLNERFTCLTL